MTSNKKALFTSNSDKEKREQELKEKSKKFIERKSR